MKKLFFLIALALALGSCSFTNSRASITKEEQLEELQRFYNVVKSSSIESSISLLSTYDEKNQYLCREAHRYVLTLLGDFSRIGEMYSMPYYSTILLRNSFQLFKYSRALKIAKYEKENFPEERINFEFISFYMHAQENAPELTNDSKEKLSIIKEFKEQGKVKNPKFIEDKLINDKYCLRKPFFQYLLTPEKFISETIEKDGYIALLQWSDYFFQFGLIRASERCLNSITADSKYDQGINIRRIRNLIFLQDYDKALKMIKENIIKYPDNKTLKYYRSYIKRIS